MSIYFKLVMLPDIKHIKVSNGRKSATLQGAFFFMKYHIYLQ